MKALPAVFAFTVLFVSFATGVFGQDNPLDRQMAELTARLADPAAEVRAGAAESLGFLRNLDAQDALLECLNDASPPACRQAVMALAWCGDRKAVEPLLAALDDADWVTRQAAHVSLTNLTGMEFPFDATAAPGERTEQIRRWTDWWATVPTDRVPADVAELLGNAPKRPGQPYSVTASTTYEAWGRPGVLVDGRVGPAYWQTKGVPPPQWATVDLGESTDVSMVVVHQYGPAFVMTEYELATSLDGEKFDSVVRKKEDTPVELVVEFPARKARFVRITSFGSRNPTYPTTFFEIEINQRAAIRPHSGSPQLADERAWRHTRALRALGVLCATPSARQEATALVLRTLGARPPAEPGYREAVRAGIRSLGRLGDEAGFAALVALLDDPMWARCAAEALGDLGDARATGPLLAAYGRYAKRLNASDPTDVPRDDKMGFPSEDRMLETPYWIIYSLCRLPLDAPADRAALGRLAPQLVANLPGDHDAMMLYDEEVAHRLTRHLLEASDMRQEACERAMVLLGQPRRVPAPAGEPMPWPKLPPYWTASSLPCVCTEKEDVPRLLALLSHPEGWVRLNAAKTIAWIGDPAAIEPVAAILREAKAEAEFGFSGTFKHEEFNDPAPRWREGLIRALGRLGARRHVPLLIEILNDPKSVLEVRRAAAEALAELAASDRSGDAIDGQIVAALREAAFDHSFLSVRNVARDAIQKRGIKVAGTGATGSGKGDLRSAVAAVSGDPRRAREGDPRRAGGASCDAIVFIKGDNNIPNTIGTVEQADRWRQTYVVTDSGPAYRPGRNLFVLRPPRPDGQVTPLTRFVDGYVAEPEVSWDGTHVLFCYRGQSDPWWHVWRVNVDGSGLKQVTFGPYHDVGPCYLPDGRIVFTSTRLGIRDEYHGYPCTGLWVGAADGTDLQPIATNIGRDNEPAVLHDGRVVFSRLEVFYSRNKTELTLHAMHPDGTKDSVFYGPERRAFWRDLDHGPRTPADGQEAPLTHRVLRMTQPQPMPDGRHVVAVTQGGLILVGLRRDTELFVSPDNRNRAYTTPFPMPDGTILCASTLKTPDRAKVDLGLYRLDPRDRTLRPVYNDPAAADFEPRPIVARRSPAPLVSTLDRRAYSGRLICTTAFATRDPKVRQQGRLVRLIEGVPVVGRHSTQTNPWEVWKNHGGTFARALGTVPLAADGSFSVDVPADRLMHFQILNSDRRVVGNQTIWIYVRPGETKSCVGCHENAHTTSRGNDPLASHFEPIALLPTGDEFSYRAKAWFKGHLPLEIEERTRTVRAVNLLGR